MPIAASAISQRMPPCSVPMGLKCCGPDCNVTTVRPLPASGTSKPMRSPTGARCFMMRSNNVVAATGAWSDITAPCELSVRLDAATAKLSYELPQSRLTACCGCGYLRGAPQLSNQVERTGDENG